jgi:cation transport protein ChaC
MEMMAGRLEAAEAASVVRGAVGKSGVNEDYLASTLKHLAALGIRDRWLAEVGAIVGVG